MLCDLRSNDDATKATECRNCFAEAMPKKEKLTWGGAREVVAEGGAGAAVLLIPPSSTAITSCSRSQLPNVRRVHRSSMEAGTDRRCH